MRWTKQLHRLNEYVYRLSCLPENLKKTPATFAAKNPDQFRPVETVERKGWQVFDVEEVIRFKFKDDGKPLSAKNLEVRWSNLDERELWKPGMLDERNLGGSFQSLDLLRSGVFAEEVAPHDPMKGFDSYLVSPVTLLDTIRDCLRKLKGPDVEEREWFREYQALCDGKPPTHFRKWPKEVLEVQNRVRHIPPGFLTGAGLSIIRDDSLPWDQKKEWVLPRPELEPQILYFVHYEDDYTEGLEYLSKIFGPIPKPENWALGTWFSCYREMGERDYKELKRDFDKHGLPLDVVVVDTDWHKLWWHGFDWNKNLFPDPKSFATWLKKNNLAAVFNVHPQYIPEKDSRLEKFLDQTGQQAKILDKKEVPHSFHAGCHSVDLFDKKQAEAYFKIFHRPIEKNGCDMWWVDGGLREPGGRDATAWMNEIYAKYGKGNMVLSRTCGLGAHRSTLHFTGDTYSEWGVLDQEVLMTPLAANVLLGYVSHDIGGFIKQDDWKENKPPDDLMVRWVQFGCFSSIFRLHSDHGIREPWRFGENALRIMRQFMNIRKELQSIFQELASTAHETGVPFCHPMYYEYPNFEDAYTFPRQYMLGPGILVAPVTNPEGHVGMWIPPGYWAHLFQPRMVEGPCVIFEEVPLDFIPVYTKLEDDIPGEETP